MVAADLTDPRAPARIAGVLEREHGALHLLVNNAGARWSQPFAAGGWANVERHMRINLEAPARLVEALLPILRRTAAAGGCASSSEREASAGRAAPVAIVNVASTASRVGRRGAGGYAAAKFALAGWTDALYLEEKPSGVHVGLVLPGFVATEGFPQAEFLRSRLTRWWVSSPEAVAEAIIEAGPGGKPERYVPRYALAAGGAADPGAESDPPRRRARHVHHGHGQLNPPDHLWSGAMTSFADLGLSGALLDALDDVGYEEPSPIQAQAIPLLLEGLDVIGQAQTGSGKTAAFGLPMLSYVDPGDHEVQGLVLTPTRELCIQVTQALRAYGSRKGVDIVAVFGGAPIRTQQSQLRAGGHVVVGTVGRVKDLISRHSLMLHSCRFVVLDEADRCSDLGFLEDVEKILALTPSSRQTALFSATMPPEIRRLADQYLYDPVVVKVKTATLTVDTVEQFALEVAARDKADVLVEVLDAERPEQAIVFVRTKIRCDQLYRTLRDRGMNVRALHGDMTQGARDGVMISFKDGRVPFLVATDVAARGLDISGVSHVINFDVPTSPDVYVHRIGRTGRVGRSGRAITF